MFGLSYLLVYVFVVVYYTLILFHTNFDNFIYIIVANARRTRQSKIPTYKCERRRDESSPVSPLTNHMTFCFPALSHRLFNSCSKNTMRRRITRLKSKLI